MIKKVFLHTKWWQIFNWDFLSGWVKSNSRNLESLVSFGQLTPLLAGSSGYNR